MSKLSRKTLPRSQAGGVLVDMDKVHAMREAIARGTYLVNPEAIADKLLANARHILQRGRH